MADNKFIFTTEGRHSLIGQLGGIKFAVLGAVLVKGLTVCDLESEFEETYKDLTLDDLTLDKGIVLGMKSVSYLSTGNYNIVPSHNDEYLMAFNDIGHNTLPVHYIPSQEVKDSQGNVYGTYEFDFDKTLITWDVQNDVKFEHLILIGKQYAETSDATFNVNKTQKPVIVGIVQLTNLPTGGLFLLKEQNEYVATKFKLRFTLDDHDRDIATTASVDEEVKNIANKISLVNNGLKTDPAIGSTFIVNGSKRTADELNLSENGGIATTKTLMVADSYNSDELENQLNPVGLIHLVNGDDDEYGYKNQAVITSIEKDDDSDGVLNSYNTVIALNGTGPEVTADYVNSGIGLIEEVVGKESPVFKVSISPETDFKEPYVAQVGYAVDIFGFNNYILGEKNYDVMLFSKNNISTDPYPITVNNADSNLLLKSNDNYFKINGGNTDNTLINSDHNIISLSGTGVTLSNTLISSNDNYIDNIKNTIFIGTNSGGFINTSAISNDSIVIGGKNHGIKNSNNIIIIGHNGLKSEGCSNQTLLGKFNDYNSSASLIYGNGIDNNNRKNALEFYPDRGELKLFNNSGNETIALGGDYGISARGLSLNNIVSDTIKANAKFILGYPASFGTPAGGMNINYNSATKETSFDISHAGYEGNVLNYDTSAGTLLIEQHHYQSSAEDYAKINKEYVEFNHVGSDGIASDKVLINQDIQYPLSDTIDQADGSFVVYKKTNSSINEVVIKADSIEFKKHNGAGLWTTTNVISAKPEYNYVKAHADIYVWGNSISDWNVTMPNFKGPDNIRDWLVNIFTKAPPILYKDGTTIPQKDHAWCQSDAGSGHNLSFTTPGNETIYTTNVATNGNRYSEGSIVQDSVYLVNNTGYHDSSTPGDNIYYKYMSFLPNNSKLDELEINLFVHDWDNFAFIWALGLQGSYSGTAPMIKVNIRKDGPTNKDAYIFTNKYYGNVGNNSELLRAYTLSYEKCLQLMCIPQKNPSSTDHWPTGWYVTNG